MALTARPASCALLLLLALLLAGCGARKTDSTSNLYQQASVLLRSEQYPAALARNGRRNAACGTQLAVVLAVAAAPRRDPAGTERDPIGAAGARFRVATGPTMDGGAGPLPAVPGHHRLSPAQFRGGPSGPGSAQALAGAAGAAGASGILAQIELRRASVAVAQTKFTEADTMLRHVLNDAAQPERPLSANEGHRQHGLHAAAVLPLGGSDPMVRDRAQDGAGRGRDGR